MGGNKLPKACWLTINRACNLRCEWCYAQDTMFHNNEMPYDMVVSLIDICTNCGINNFLLIGGEPTIHSSFFEILKYLSDIKCKVTVVTNGILLHQTDFCNRIASFKDNTHVSISLKGASDEYYKKHCGAKAFHKVKEAIENCRDNKIPFSLSYVISAENIDSIINFANEVRKSGINEHISFSFCNETLDSAGDMNDVYTKYHPVVVNHHFSKHYEQLNSVLHEDFSLHQTYPLCVCDNDTLSAMISRKQVSTSCHVHNRSGVIFDTDGSILLCNHFVGYGIGKYGVDYYDAQSFLNFWTCDDMVNLHKKLTSMPSEDCMTCSKKENCGGGCCIQWFAHSYNEYQSVFNELSKLSHPL